MLNVFRPTSKPALRRLAALTALACSTALVASCGGGDRAAPFVPSQMVSFGDENSLIDSYQPAGLTKTDGSTAGTIKGLVYTVNSLGVGPIDANTAGNFYLCADPSPTTNYVACDSSNGTVIAGSTLDTTLNVSGTSWYLDPDYANRFIAVRRGTTTADTVTARRMDVLYAYGCSGASIWTQVVAHNFKLGYRSYNGAEGQCPTDQYSNAVTYAAYGARIADVVQQVNAHLGELSKGTLVTVQAGQWDLMDAYNEYVAYLATTPTPTDEQKAAKLSALTARIVGKVDDLIGAIQAIARTGAQTVVAQPADLGQSPYVDKGQSDAMTTLTQAFFNRLILVGSPDVIPQQGRRVALVETSLQTNPTTRNTAYTYAPYMVCPAADTYTTTTTTTTDGSGNPVTTTTSSGNTLLDPVGVRVKADTYTGYDALQAVKFCNTLTTTLQGSTSTYMWADAIHLSTVGHLLIGATAYSRAANQF